MTTLYVIGNGFDLWHGLPTGYDQFYEFAKDTLDEVEGYYYLDLTQRGPWCDFENSLGRFDWHLFYEAHDNTDVTAESFRPSEAYGLEDDLAEQADNYVNAIRECFQEWVDKIDISAAKKQMTFAPEDRFFTFNYTSTLQSVYGIEEEKVFHIHGRSERFDELVFGHGESMEEEPELDENGDSNRTMFTDAEGAAKYPFYALQKPVGDVLKRNQLRFELQRDVTDIVVIGHSFNDIDLPYFKKLAECGKGARWRICCYEAVDKVHHVQQLLKCGVREESIQICTYSDLKTNCYL